MTAQGPRKGEPSQCSMRKGFRTQPAHSVRGSSRRIMSMRFRPANIRVINRRVCSSAVVGPAVPDPAQDPPAGTCSLLRRPSNLYPLPERCSQSRVRFAAPNTSAPLTAARRSGPWIWRRAAPAGTLNDPLKNNTRQPYPRDLTGSLHIRTCTATQAEFGDLCRIRSRW